MHPHGVCTVDSESYRKCHVRSTPTLSSLSKVSRRDADVKWSELAACAGYIQITADQKELWDSDVSAFVADEEDDMVSVRTSGQLVLDELLRQADGAAGILAGAVRRRLDEAAQAKVLPGRIWGRAHAVHLQ